jgi:hypothetical protein
MFDLYFKSYINTNHHSALYRCIVIQHPGSIHIFTLLSVVEYDLYSIFGQFNYLKNIYSNLTHSGKLCKKKTSCIVYSIWDW